MKELGLSNKYFMGLKYGFIILAFLLSFKLIQADAGPKPQIILTIKDAPSEVFYVDLLVQNENTSESLLELADYDLSLIETLKSQEKLGWYPALVNGTQTRMMGDVLPDWNNQEATFTYTQSIPDLYRIILVTQSGTIVISEPIQTKAFMTRIEFDALSGDVSSPNWFMNYSKVFALMLIVTFLVEGKLLFAFKLINRHNLSVFAITNLVTQVFLLLTSAYAYYYYGLILVIFVVLIDEWIILISETLIYAKFLTESSKKRRIFYAISANLLSFIGGLIIAMYF